MKSPRVSVNILILNNNKVLLGLLTKRWNYEGQQVYGVPGRDIHFHETIGDAVKRNIKDEIDCEVTGYKIFCVNANYAFGNHYIGIGVTAEIQGIPKVLKPADWEKWEWFDKNSLPANLFPDAKNIIECYRENKFNIAE